MLVFESDRIGKFLQTNFARKVTSVKFIGAGMFSCAYSFALDNQNYIFRTNAYKEDFQKDALACDRFYASNLPIPKVIKIGRFNDKLYYAISKCCTGWTLNELNAKINRIIVPQLFATLEAIHTQNISYYQGWGLTDYRGKGLFNGWSDYLLSFYNQKFNYDWENLFQKTFLEKDVCQKCLERMTKLLLLCPTQKYLVHGDFGFDNVISNGYEITGVLDWAEMRLGDFLYDIAYLDFYSKAIPYSQLWKEYAEGKNYDLSHFEERMHCYQLSIGLHGMAIAAIGGDEQDYLWTKERARPD